MRHWLSRSAACADVYALPLGVRNGGWRVAVGVVGATGTEELGGVQSAASFNNSTAAAPRPGEKQPPDREADDPEQNQRRDDDHACAERRQQDPDDQDDGNDDEKEHEVVDSLPLGFETAALRTPGGLDFRFLNRRQRVSQSSVAR
jgi:hypothetical protein